PVEVSAPAWVRLPEDPRASAPGCMRNSTRVPAPLRRASCERFSCRRPPSSSRAWATRPGQSPAPAVLRCSWLQRIQERDDLVLLRGREVDVVVDHGIGFTEVPQDGLVPRERLPVVHQPIPGAHPPERRRPDPVARRLSPVLNDPVSRPYVV